MLSRRPRALVLTLSFGSGHLRAAAAVAEALRADAPNADIRVIDALEGCNPLFRALYVWPYWLMIRYAPWLWDRFFAARLRNRTDETAPQWAFRLGCRRVFRAIAEFDPEVIVAAEVAACEIATIAQQRGVTAAPIVSLVTDHHAEPAWVKPGVQAYAVGSTAVRDQLCEWGAPRERITVTGIPTSARFQAGHDPLSTRARYGIPVGRPIVLLMGGGMGPTRMDLVADALCADNDDVQVVAVAGHDARARARLERIAPNANGALTVLGWVDDVPALMKAAAVLVTKPGGLTTAEAAVCGASMVMFDPIPGPEEHNAALMAQAGAGVLTRGTAETVSAVSGLLRDDLRRATMAARARELAAPAAATTVAKIVWEARDSARGFRTVILTIRNGAGHTKAAEAIASAIDLRRGAGSAMVIDVADYMSFFARLTHVDVYLWLVRHAPALWDRIDRYQKRQPHTSPEWYYRRGCQRLFAFVERAQPSALVATEVGCLEIAALIKRDLDLSCPLVAVNGEYDADRSWVQPEVDLYTVPRDEVRDELSVLGAPRHAVRAWGVPLAPEFAAPINRSAARESACLRLGLKRDQPIVVVSGGSEGLGRPDELAARLLAMEGLDIQVIVLAGRNAGLKDRCLALSDAQGGSGRLRALGWTSIVRELMEAADVLVSKPGHTFDEAIATELPMVVLPPPPGSERVQYRLLAEWGVGYPVQTQEEMTAVVTRLLTDSIEYERCRAAAAARRNADAATRIAQWIDVHAVAPEREVRIGEERSA
jgi:processive 1,2-diacylglycerol beta-glucosyltransferase